MLALNPKHPQLAHVMKMIVSIQYRLDEIEKEKYGTTQDEVEHIAKGEAQQETE